MALPDVQLKRLIQLYNDGQTAREISNEMGLTLGTVNGALFRARKAGIEIRTKGKTVKKETKPRVRRVKVEAKTPEASMEIKEPKEPTIYNLEPGQCKYPTKMSESNEQLFCTAPTDRIYCDKHHKLCHVPGSTQTKTGYIRPFKR